MCGCGRTASCRPPARKTPSSPTSPDLGPLFEFQEKTPGACPGLDRVHCFCYPAALSHGAATGDIPQISDGAQRLARGLAARLLSEDVDRHFAAMQRYDEPELFGDEWTPGGISGLRGRRRGRTVTGWLLRRLAQAALVVLLMTAIVFVGLHAIGNPIDILIGEDLNQQERLQAIARLGLDQPLWRQYLAFVDGALHGQLGKSFVYQEDAIRLILHRLPATMELAVGALLLAVIIGVPLGLFAGMKPDHPLAKA